RVFLRDLAVAVQQFVVNGLVADSDRARYDRLLRSTHRLLDSRVSNLIIVFLSYTLTVALASRVSPEGVSTWMAPITDGAAHLSLAGWWRTLVSHPLFFALGGAWLFRLVLWYRILWSL